MNSIGKDLADQYDRAWDMLRATVKRFTTEQWKSGPNKGQVPARWALHTVSAADFYSRSQQEGFKSRFGVNMDDPIEKLPDQGQILGYIAELSERQREWFTSMSDEAMFEKNDFPWTGDSILQQNLYQLRHSMYHIGELSMLLRSHGAEETEWA